ncbi:MAG: hypothetical protein LRY73_20110 [Bacillus sp. (in: Bacteria)]|nr:hypothetical protein [Bacillus sp. (in: firmicutes)]
MEFILLFLFFTIVFYLVFSWMNKNRRKLTIVKGKNGATSPSPLKKKIDKELRSMAVDQEHYMYLVALSDGRISEKQYDTWAHSRKKEGQEVFRKVLRRPYSIEKL